MGNYQQAQNTRYDQTLMSLIRDVQQLLRKARASQSIDSGAKPASSSAAVMCAKSLNVVAPRSGSTAGGPGYATAEDVNPSTGGCTNTTTITYWNTFPSTVASGVNIVLAKQQNSNGTSVWVLLEEYCP